MAHRRGLYDDKASNRANRGSAPRVPAILGTTLLAAACLAACTASSEPTATPTASPAKQAETPLAEPAMVSPSPTVVAPSPTASVAGERVQAFEGPPAQPVKNGTTHVLRNPNPAASDFAIAEYTVPPGWETDGVYIGKNLGQPDEVAISFWTPPGVYADPCRRATVLSPFELAEHTHDDDGGLILLDFPNLGLSAQTNAGRLAFVPRSVMVDDPSESEGTIAPRFEMTVSEDLDISSCDDGVYVAWPGSTPEGRPNDNHVAGQTDIIYLVDVDLGPLVIDASFRPESSPEDIEELYAVLGSVVVDRY